VHRIKRLISFSGASGGLKVVSIAVAYQNPYHQYFVHRTALRLRLGARTWPVRIIIIDTYVGGERFGWLKVLTCT
jgi:hypothetical protein